MEGGAYVDEDDVGVFGVAAPGLNEVRGTSVGVGLGEVRGASVSVR